MDANFKTIRPLAVLGTVLLAWTASPAFASMYLFTNGGAGAVGITVGDTNMAGGTVLLNLAANNDVVTMPTNTDMAIALAAGDKITISSGTITGQVDFADQANVNAGHYCPAEPNGNCMFNSGSTITNGSISGLTQQNTNRINSAVNEWLGLINTSTGWGSVAGKAVNLSSGGTLCAGVTGCSAANTLNTTVTKTINGVSQTAYVFDITSSGDHINGGVTIKGDGTTLIILNYSGNTKLQSNQIISLSGVTSDQVLMNVTATGGMQTSGGFSFAGALAISGGGTIDLDSAHINGRVYLSGSTTGSIQSNFALVAPPDVESGGAATPEPCMFLLVGGALVCIALGPKRLRAPAPAKRLTALP